MTESERPLPATVTAGFSPWPIARNFFFSLAFNLILDVSEERDCIGSEILGL